MFRKLLHHHPDVGPPAATTLAPPPLSPELPAPTSQPATATRSGRISVMPKRYSSDTALAMTPVHSACTAVNLDENGVPLIYARAMAGPDGTLWNEAAIEEFGRLIEKTGSMQFIPAHEKPADRSASYYNPRVRIKLKEGKIVRRVRGTVGGDRIDYLGAVLSANADCRNDWRTTFASRI